MTRAVHRPGAWHPIGNWWRGGAESSGPARRGVAGWGWLAALLAALLALALLITLLGKPVPQLSELVLDGPRGPVCERIVLLTDQSGSMSDLAAPRDATQAELLDWLPRNLRPDDELAVVDFAASARVRLAPTRMSDLTSASGRAPAVVEQGQETLLRPAVDAVGAFASTSCDVDVLLLSDGLLSDLPSDPAAGSALLLNRRIHDLRLLVPAEDGVVPDQWHVGFPDIAPDTFDGLDPDAGALVVGKAVASSTGQRLAR